MKVIDTLFIAYPHIDHNGAEKSGRKTSQINEE